MYGFRIYNPETLKAGTVYEVVEQGTTEKLESHIKNLEAVIERQKETIINQGDGCEERHNVLCEIKEIIDEYFLKG